MKTTLTPRDYQMKSVSTICDLHSNNKSSRIVLASAAGSGKTEMAIMIIDNFIKSGLGRVLVVAHHTNIIKSNFIDRLNDVNVSFTYSDTDINSDCFVAIRSNSINRIDSSQFNLIVVDEAHQNYFASTIQSIVNNISHQVLLTATPSKFVNDGGFDIIPVARLDIPNKYFASLSFRVVNAETSITDDSYNADNVVKTSVKFNRDEVKSIVDSVIPFLDDKKKLFICKDIHQAKSTALYLNSLSINSYVSDSKSDPDSVIVNNFKSGSINSLVVVDRMRVGYSDNDLYHTVDMSFTHNPDVIMQILSRSNRGNQSQSKTYIKVTNNKLNTRTRFMLSVAISLFRFDNLISYNGLNTNNVKVPVTKNSVINRNNSSSSDNWFIPDNIDVIDFFSNCDFVNSSSVISALSGCIDYNYCIQTSKSYTNYNSFKLNNPGCNAFLRRNDLLDKFISDVNWSIRSKNMTDYSTFTDDDLLSIATQYESAKVFANSNKNAYTEATSRNLDIKYKCVCVQCSSEFLASKKSKYCSSDCKKIVDYAAKKAYKLNKKLSK